MEIKGIKFYDGNIKELPMARYNLFNQMLTNDTGVGNDMKSINTHLKKLVHFASLKDTEAIATEANNLILSYYSAIKQLSFKSRSIAALIQSIDGKQYGNTMSDEEFEQAVKIIEDRLTVETAEQLMIDVKKKLLQI